MRRLLAPDALPPLMREIQGNIVVSYGRRFRAVRHLVLEVADPAKARAALGLMADGDRSTPDVTTAERSPTEARFRWCLNLGFTYPGLVGLGVPEASRKSFPLEFREGMAARAARLGDVGESEPARWDGGLASPERVHVIATIHGCTRADTEQISDQVLAAAGGRAFTLLAEPFDGEAITADTDPDGTDPGGPRFVHFGYADGISQPRFTGIHDPAAYPDTLPFSPLGSVLLGYPSTIPHVAWTVPKPEILGHNGTFNAFRVLGQDVAGFEAFLSTAAAASKLDRELIAAKLCGRWRSGVPLALAPDAAAEAAFDGDVNALNAFNYLGEYLGQGGGPAGAGARDAAPEDDGSAGAGAGDEGPGGEPYKEQPDPDGMRCPVGSHIRRTNPRAAHIVQRAANRSRSLVRRGVPYGPRWIPGDPSTRDLPRGLLGNFICASLAAQFEAMQYDWVNLGFQDPRITGTNDPLVGANDPLVSQFTFPQEVGDPVTLREIPRFVFTRGGAYTFLPSIPAIRWMASQSG